MGLHWNKYITGCISWGWISAWHLGYTLPNCYEANSFLCHTLTLPCSNQTPEAKAPLTKHSDTISYNKLFFPYIVYVRHFGHNKDKITNTSALITVNYCPGGPGCLKSAATIRATSITGLTWTLAFLYLKVRWFVSCGLSFVLTLS